MYRWYGYKTYSLYYFNNIDIVCVIPPESNILEYLTLGEKINKNVFIPRI